jgi:hypothetical protein
MADVEVGLAVGDRIIDAGELRVVLEIDVELKDEVVGDDVLLEVGTRLANGQELVESVALLLGYGCSRSGRALGQPSRSATLRSLVDRLASAGCRTHGSEEMAGVWARRP